MNISNTIMAGILFAGLMATYGIGTGGPLATSLQNTFSVIGAPWPNGPNLAKCSFFDIGCNLGNVPAWSAGNIFWIAALAQSFFIRTTAITAISNDLTFGVWLQLAGTGFVFFIALGLMAVVGIEFVRIARGSPGAIG